MVKCLNIYFQILCNIFLFLPIAILLVWAGIFFKLAEDKSYNYSYISPCGILLIGNAAIFFVLGVMKIKWNNYRITRTNVIFFMIAFISFTAYQFIAVMFDSQSENFFGYSSLFLSTNCFVIILMIFLNSGIEGASMRWVINNKMEITGNVRDKDRNEDFEDEINREMEDLNYIPCKEDITDLFTIASVSESKF